MAGGGAVRPAIDRRVATFAQGIRSSTRWHRDVGCAHDRAGAAQRSVGDCPAFPHVDDDTGRLATRLLREFGSGILKRARKPWDHVIALSVLRYAARRLRGERREDDPGDTGASAVADVLAIQSYAEENGLSPMLVGYSGPGKPAAQALGLLRDARTLRDAVRSAEAGGDVRVSTWQRAIDFHAFAVVALDHRMLLDLPLDEAYEIAAAAIRQAEAARLTPDLVDMPRLPHDSVSAPDVVRLHAKACPPSGDAGVPQ